MKRNTVVEKFNAGRHYTDEPQRVQLTDTISLALKWEVDDNPDTDWLGEFVGREPNVPWFIDREEGYLIGPELELKELTHTFTGADLEKEDEGVTIEDLADRLTDEWEDKPYHSVDWDDRQVDSQEQITITVSSRIWREYMHRSDRNEYEYFVPYCGGQNDWKTYREGVTDEEMAKYAVQDYERMHGLQHDDWCFLGCVAEVYMDGHDIGGSSLWGIESDGEDDYLTETARGEMSGAVKEAIQWLEKIGAKVPVELQAVYDDVDSIFEGR